MLHELRIQNLVLFESTTVVFSRGLNILTGETGSGKSAIMAALRLIGGERADAELIRHGSEKAIIEAVFSSPSRELAHLLEESGISFDPTEPIIIRREIGVSGKGKVHINHQSVLVSLLRTLSPFLFEMVTQHANQMLFSTDAHRQILDTFGGLEEKVNVFTRCWEEEKSLVDEKHTLTTQNSERLRLTARYEAEIEELNEAHLQEGEEDELFNEYTKLINAEEIAKLVEDITEELAGDEKPILTRLNRHLTMLEKLGGIDPKSKDLALTFKNAVSELQEVSYSLRRYRNGIDSNPEKAFELNERLTLLNKLKRKYGSTVSEMLAYLEETETKLASLQNADDRLEKLDKEIALATKKTEAAAQALTAARTKAATALSKALTKEIRSLNMPKAELEVTVTQAKRSKNGDDHIEIMMSPNVGEKQISVKECASGGEISRLLLSLKTLLAGLQATPCLIFDEVDANIGGETATIVGQKLYQIAQSQQLLCITHFPQVAEQADHHLRVSKSEVNGRTVGAVVVLDGVGRQREKERMLGHVASNR